ncbi:hypothetical protein ABQD56_13180 [Vagococcus fluvialis]|uniref:hypothetical protein n=1 Tax=Vagococcus fluvialis TaxID=2738 RepID=UPI0032E3762A
MQNKVLTLKQLADKLDVSKSYIDKTIRTLGMHTELKKDGNRYVVNPTQQREIEVFLDNKKSHTESHTQSNTSMHTSESSEVVFLRSQLIERNKEIENLHKILDQQQQLQLKTQNLLEEQKLIMSADKEPENETNKFKDSIENQQQQLDQLKSELEQKKLENEELKVTVEELKQPPKKNFWQRLFNQ